MDLSPQTFFLTRGIKEEDPGLIEDALKMKAR